MRVLLVLLIASITAPAQSGAPTEEETKALQRFVSELRGLPFEKPVPATSLPLSQLRATWKMGMEMSTPAERFEADAKALAKMGLVPAGTDLEATLLDMYTYGIHAYYDPRGGQLFVIDRSEAHDATMYSMLADMSLAAEGTRIDLLFCAHELTHALQDQHFGYFARLGSLQGDDDRLTAARCLSEGEANLMLYEYVASRGGRSAEDLFSATGTHAFDCGLPMGVAGFDRAPRYLRESFLFPYTEGVRFVRELRRRGGWEAVTKAYGDFPSSTEQVLHPEKYLGTRDVPQEVTLPALPLDGWKELKRGVMGEMGCRILLGVLAPDLGDEKSASASAGWDGDTYAVWENEKDGRLLLVWASTWDGEEDAEEFLQAYAKALLRRHPDATSSVLGRGAFDLSTEKNGDARIRRLGSDVVIVEGSDAGTQALAKMILEGLKKAELR